MIKNQSKFGPQYWLIKSEGDSYSVDDLKKDKKTGWTGIRNYQARNFMRDSMRVDDLILFYHSSAEPIGVYGIAKVASGPKLDPTSINKKDEHYDEASVKREAEIKAGKRAKNEHIWMMVDVHFVRKFKRPVSLCEMKLDAALEGMPVLRKGMRLSVQPVSEKHFKHVEELGAHA